MEETDPATWNTYQEDNTAQKWEVLTGSAYIRVSHFTLDLVDPKGHVPNWATRVQNQTENPWENPTISNGFQRESNNCQIS